MRRRRARRWLGVLFGLLVVYLAEIALRLVGVAPAYQADAIGGWRMLGEQHAQEIVGREGGRFVLTTNAEGLRTSLAHARTPGVPRVALMGDSTTFGWGADDGGTVADGLAATLPGVEVLNAGQPGYSTTQIARLFDEVVRRYEPDLTVVFLPLHDHNRVLVSDREHLDGAAGPAAAIRVALARHSRIYQVLRRAVFPLHERAFLLPQDATREPRVPRVSDAERADALAAMQAAMAAWNGRLALGHLPFHAELTGAGGERAGEAWARAWAEANGAGLVDLRACCRGGDLTLPYDPGHLTARGNRLVGEAAAAPIAALLGR